MAWDKTETVSWQGLYLVNNYDGFPKCSHELFVDTTPTISICVPYSRGICL